MTLRPLLAAAALIQLHAVTAMAAFALGAAQLALPKGTVRHRGLGWIWAGLMVMVAASSFGIRTLNPGRFSFVHAVTIFILVMLPIGLLHARAGRVRRHAVTMTALFVGALVIAGGFTLLPSRIIGQVVFAHPPHP